MQNVTTLNTATDKSALESLKPLVLSIQSSDERISKTTLDLLPAAIRACHRSMMPAGQERLAVEINQLREWAKAFNVPREEIITAAKFYQESLSHLPSDLLAEAFKGIRATHRWGMRLPMPAEILGQVSHQLAERERLRGKLELAQRCTVEEENPQATEDEKRKVTELLAHWRTTRATP